MLIGVLLIIQMKRGGRLRLGICGICSKRMIVKNIALVLLEKIIAVNISKAILRKMAVLLNLVKLLKRMTLDIIQLEFLV